LPAEAGAAITWGAWARAAFPLGISFFVFSYLAILVLYRPSKGAKLNPMVIEAQLRTLGPLTLSEKISLATVTFSILGFLTQPWHHVNGAWIAILSFLILFVSSVLDEKSIRADIDWNFLISFGALVGFGNVISASGLTGVMAKEIGVHLEIFTGNKLMFLLVISVAVHLVRFLLPLTPALVVSILSITPVLSTLGVNPLVIGLVVLASSNPWFFPHQDNVYLNILQYTEGKLFRHEQTWKLACLHVLIVMLAVAMSLSYWRYLGLIS
jgi:di/tricarboxylate transporter